MPIPELSKKRESPFAVNQTAIATGKGGVVSSKFKRIIITLIFSRLIIFLEIFSKKIAEKFGGFKNPPYLCTR